MKKFMIMLLVAVIFFQLEALHAAEYFTVPPFLPSKNPKLQPTISIKCFPETCQVGDTIYLMLEAGNPHNEDIMIEYCISPFLHNIRIDFFDSEKKIIPYLFDVSHRVIFNVSPTHLLLRPKEKGIIWCYSMTMPPLEDLYEQKYWRDWLKNCPEQGQIFQIRTKGFLFHPNKNTYTSQCTFTLNRRTKKELEFFETWYKNTHQELFPAIEKCCGSPMKISSKYDQELHKKLQPLDRNFLRTGNRYPGYPNLPKDWQGWKKLEESFEPSTLRDEIRWTRICVQYCVTGDDKVLDELKTWLEKMNPIQRIVMVNNYYFRDTNLPNCRKLYETIQLFKDKK